MVNERILNDHEFIALKGWCHPFSFILKDCSESLVLGVTVLHAFLKLKVLSSAQSHIPIYQ